MRCRTRGSALENLLAIPSPQPLFTQKTERVGLGQDILDITQVERCDDLLRGLHDTSKSASENWHGEPQRPEWPIYLQYLQLQLTEFLTRHGPVAIVWFDGLDDQQKYDRPRVLEMIHQLQPATLVNNRIGVDADYETLEQFIPTAIPTRGVRLTGIDPNVSQQLKNGVPRPEDFRLWETCMTINDTWAYNKNDRNFKSERDLIRGLVEVASRGGNLLLNVGPQPDGRIQPEFQQRLRAIGDWLTLNGDAIYGSTFGLLQGASGLRTTARDKAIFVHLFDWPNGVCTVSGLSANALGALARHRQAAHISSERPPARD